MYEIGDNSVRTKIEEGEIAGKKKKDRGHVLVCGGVQLGQIFLSQILVTYRPVRCQAVCNASIFSVFCFVFLFFVCVLCEGVLVNISFVFLFFLCVNISFVFAGSAWRIRPPCPCAWRLASECGYHSLVRTPFPASSPVRTST